MDSVDFGLKAFEPQDVLAIVLHDVTEEGHHAHVHTTDGSVYSPKSVTIDHGRIRLDDESAGQLSLSIRDLDEIRN